MRLEAMLLLLFVVSALGEKAAKKKKDPRDYTDADLERLYEQWEEDEEPLEEDELPEHKRKQKPLDMAKVNMADPASLLAASKKGKTVMMFVAVAGSPDRDEAEELTGLWQSSLFNNHMEVQRFMIEDDRAIFMFQDGAQAWEAKEFLLMQERCKEVNLEGQSYKGKGAYKEEL